MILGFLFFMQTFLKHCKTLSTETYRRYINISLLLLLFIYYELRACFVREKHTKKYHLFCMLTADWLFVEERWDH